MATQVDAAGAGEYYALGAQQRGLLLRAPAVPRAARLAAVVHHTVRGDVHAGGALGQGA